MKLIKSKIKCIPGTYDQLFSSINTLLQNCHRNKVQNAADQLVLLFI